MWMMLLGVLAFLIGDAAFETRFPAQPVPDNQFELPMANVGGGATPMSVTMKPLVDFKFEHIVHQAYDYSCGSAALTTIINYYLGIKVTEQEAMDGMMAHGERDKIIARRGFSLLDMKRYVATLGADSAGFKGEMKDLEELKQPAIVPIDYAGFKHFVVFRAIRKGKVYLADPSAGHIVFSEKDFAELWDRNTMFLLYPPKSQGEPNNLLALTDEEMGVIDDDLVRRQAQFPPPDIADAMRAGVQSKLGIFNLRN